jgi:hypothetical protein
MKRLPLAFRCERRWAEMEGGGEVVRRCTDCGCDVVNLSSLDEETARTLLAQRRTTGCVSYRWVRGEIVFSKVRNAVAAAAAAAVFLAAAPGSADTALPAPQVKPPQRQSKGKGDAAKKRSGVKRPKKERDHGEDDGGPLAF